jgi:hypothetical protein
MPYRAQTEIEAANLALGAIGEPPIGTFQDNSARARRCLQFFGQVRDELQRDNDYGFCAAWFVPAMDPVPALGRLKNRFVMAADCLKVRNVLPFRPSSTQQQGISITDPNIIAELEAASNAPFTAREWDIESATVNPNDVAAGAIVMVTNIAQPIVSYSRQVVFPRLWDALFTEAFVKELAAALAPSIAKDINAGDKLRGDARERIDDAARTDSREQSPRQVSRDTSWVRSRMLGRGSFRG